MKVLTLMADTPDFQRFVKRLASDGYQVVQANNHDEACEYLQNGQIQAAVLDFDIASAELVRRIRDVGAPDYIYVFGLLSAAGTGATNKKSGLLADEYIFKPMEPDELIARLVIVDRYIKTLTDIRAKQKYPEPIRDAVTGTFSQSTIHELLTTEVSRSRRTRKKFVLAVLALDGASNIRVKHNRDSLNKALSQVALKIWASVRAYDLIGRWGKTGFMLLLPETTLSGATVVAERIRQNVSSVPLGLPDEIQLQLSASMGFVQASSRDFISVDDLITEAENSLAKAEQVGGNHIVFAWDA
ncbi:MAG: diguanylate cyclase [Anaerolineales bacterium]|nr:diguanylate cyclase [Chloroflexota bacterium]MBL7161352.1 diguanylate cyclase [Anaerolineales bacterium]